jgi:hypothetical protein
MTDFEINLQENSEFISLEKQGYGLYINSNKSKFLYKSKSKTNEEKIISDDIIFKNVYSHELNENDIPLVEFYYLLINNKIRDDIISQEPLSTPSIPASTPSYSISPTPFLITNPDHVISERQQTSPTPFLITNPDPVISERQQTSSTFSTNQRSFPLQQSSSPIQALNNLPLEIQYDPLSPSFSPSLLPILQIDNGKPSNISKSTSKSFLSKIKEFFTTIKDSLSKLFGNKQQLNYILGEKYNDNSNIKTEYQNRYPPDFKGTILDSHKSNYTTDAFKGNNRDDTNLIESIAVAWNNYIDTSIKGKTSYDKKLNVLKTNNIQLDTDFIRMSINNQNKYNFIMSKFSNIDPFDDEEYREISIAPYTARSTRDNPLEHVNYWGYPLVRAYKKRLEFYDKIFKTYDDNTGKPVSLDDVQFTMQKGGIFDSSSQFEYAWNYEDGKITRFNGYYKMNYDKIKKNIFEYSENTNMNIKFFVFSIDTIKKVLEEKITFIIVKTSDVKLEPLVIENSYDFLEDNKDNLYNKIIAKISTNTNSDIYILFDVNIKIKSNDKIYKEEDKNKIDFANLNNDLKKIIEYYNILYKLAYFKTYGEIEKNLNAILNEDSDDKILDYYKIDLGLRISICKNILLSPSIDDNIKKNIKEYNKLLNYTLDNIDDIDKTKYIERIKLCAPLLKNRIRYYGENFIYY